MSSALMAGRFPNRQAAHAILGMACMFNECHTSLVMNRSASLVSDDRMIMS